MYGIFINILYNGFLTLKYENMLLEEAMKTHELNNGKIDILGLLGIKIDDNHMSEDYYLNKIDKLNTGDYFFSDLDGTFFRGMLSKETFSLFVKFVKQQDLLTLDSTVFKDFLDDNKYFDELEKKAYNKTIDYNDYINAGTFLLFKYRNLIDWNDFLFFLKQSFKKREMVNPFRFSFAKVKEVLENGDNFVFVSGAPHFALEIYLDILRLYIEKETGVDYGNNISGFGTYIGFENPICIGLFGSSYKDTFIKSLIKTNKVNKIIGGMGDTSSDYGISYNLDDNADFFFVNPEQSVLSDYKKLKSENINYRIIFERKNLIFEIKPEEVNILDM